MKLTLEVKKQGVDITPSEEAINEQFTLDYGHIFRGLSAYEQAQKGGYSKSESEFNRELGRLSSVVHTDDIVDNLNSSDNKKPLSANQGSVLNRNKVGYVEYDRNRRVFEFWADRTKASNICTVDATELVNADKIDKVKGIESYIPMFAADGQIASSGFTKEDLRAMDVRADVISYNSAGTGADTTDYNAVFGTMEPGKAQPFVQGCFRMEIPHQEGSEATQPRLVPAKVSVDVVNGAFQLTLSAVDYRVNDVSKEWNIVYDLVPYSDKQGGYWKYSSKYAKAITPAEYQMSDLTVGRDLQELVLAILTGRGAFIYWQANNATTIVTPIVTLGSENILITCSATIDGVGYTQTFVLDYAMTIVEVGKLESHSQSSPYEEITYLELLAKKNDGKLIAGKLYRITDFVTTSGKEGTKSANHPFDIVVQALDSKTLSEDASAMLHEGDTYFANSKLEAWRLRYCLDNNSDRFEWAIEDTPEKPQEWKCSWGVLESKRNADPSSKYLTAVVDGVTKYLYAPENRGSYLNNKTFYRELGIREILSPNELIFEADNAPYVEDDYDDWANVSVIRVKTADGTIVDRFYNDESSQYYPEDDRNSGNYEYSVYFNPHPRYDEDKEVYIYTISSGGDEWWNDYHGGRIEVVEKEYYTGSLNALYYAFDTPLPQTSSQPKPQIYSTQTHLIYKSTNWSDTVKYTPYTPLTWNGGKGVIYGMLDEWQNECGYDFKNILTTYDGKDYYTFSYISGSTISDRTVVCEYTINNKIVPYIVNTSWGDGLTIKGARYRLGGIVFKDTYIDKTLRNNYFGNSCNTIVLGSGCRDNYFAEFCTNITLGDNCYNNLFGKSCSYITFKSGSSTSASNAQYMINCNFDMNTKYVQLWNSGDASSTKAVRYYQISQSVSGTSSSISVIQVNRGKTTDTHLAKNSSGTVKQWCDADLA